MKKGCAVTIGFFDGVHQGHRYLLQQLEEMASDEGLSAVVVTFDRHPKEVVSTDFAPSLLTIQTEKLSLLSQFFKGEIIVLPFTRELGALGAKEFMDRVLKSQLDASLLMMGYNHSFGHGGGTMEDYVAWGKEVGIEVCRAEALAGEKVSSSRIRTLITESDIEHANKLLGYPYFLTGKVVSGRRIGRRIGFPTANLLVPKQKLLPANGVYAVRATLPNGERRAAMLSIGHRPTIEENGEISVEVHILDYVGNLYGKSISVDFIAKLRNEQHFSSLDALQRQLSLDAVSAKEKLASSQ